MKTDLYTKIVLTIIAVCLVVIAFRNVPKVSATGRQYLQSVNIAAIAGYPLFQPILPVDTYEFGSEKPDGRWFKSP